MQCDDVADRLSDVAEGSLALDRQSRRHVERCLRCQAELVQYRKLLRALHTLRTEVLDPAPGLLADILSTIEQVGERQAAKSMLSGRRMAYVGGIAAAATAGAAGAILIAARTRKSGRIRLAG